MEKATHWNKLQILQLMHNMQFDWFSSGVRDLSYHNNKHIIHVMLL